jgi:hypothetical protein
MQSCNMGRVLVLPTRLTEQSQTVQALEAVLAEARVDQSTVGVAYVVIREGGYSVGAAGRARDPDTTSPALVRLMLELWRQSSRS